MRTSVPPSAFRMFGIYCIYVYIYFVFVTVYLCLLCTVFWFMRIKMIGIPFPCA